MEATAEVTTFRSLLADRNWICSCWLGDPIPALENRTPREAVQSKSGRERVKALVNEIEYLEASLPAGERFDTSILRRSLQL